MIINVKGVFFNIQYTKKLKETQSFAGLGQCYNIDFKTKTIYYTKEMSYSDAQKVVLTSLMRAYGVVQDMSMEFVLDCIALDFFDIEKAYQQIVNDKEFKNNYMMFEEITGKPNIHT